MNLFCSTLAYSGSMSSKMFYQNVSAFNCAHSKKYYYHVAILAQFQLLFFHVYSMLLRQCSSSLEEGVDRL